MVKAGVYSIPASALEDLSNDPEVAYISLDRQVRAQSGYVAQTVGASIAWQLDLNGTTDGVAVIDSDVTNHADGQTPCAQHVSSTSLSCCSVCAPACSGPAAQTRLNPA